MSTESLTKEQVSDRDQFVERMLESTQGVFDIFTIYIGVRLGLYEELSQNGPLTAKDLASRTGTDERADQHQEGGFGKMKIGEQLVHDSEPIRRMDK